MATLLLFLILSAGHCDAGIWNYSYIDALSDEYKFTASFKVDNKSGTVIGGGAGYLSVMTYSEKWIRKDISYPEHEIKGMFGSESPLISIIRFENHQYHVDVVDCINLTWEEVYTSETQITCAKIQLDILILSVGKNLHIGKKNEGGWVFEKVADAQEMIENVEFYENDIIFTCKNEIYFVKYNGSWSDEKIWSSSSEIKTLIVDDVMGDDKKEIICMNLGNQVDIISFANFWVGNTVYTSERYLLGISSGHVLDNDKNSIILSEKKSVRILKFDNNVWNVIMPWSFNKDITSVSVGKYHTRHKNDEIFILLSDGEVGIVGYYTMKFRSEIIPPKREIFSENFTYFTIRVSPEDIPELPLKVDISKLPKGMYTNISHIDIKAKQPFVEIKFVLYCDYSLSNGDYEFLIEVKTSAGLIERHKIFVVINWSFSVDVDVVPTDSPYAKAGDKITYTIAIKNSGKTEDIYNISVWTKNNWTVKMLDLPEKKCNLSGGAIGYFHIEIDVPKNASGRNELLFVKAQSLRRQNVSKERVYRIVVSQPSMCAIMLIFAFLAILPGIIKKKTNLSYSFPKYTPDREKCWRF